MNNCLEHLRDLFDGLTDWLLQTMQIFYPYSTQIYPDVFPGTDPRDCPRNMSVEQYVSLLLRYTHTIYTVLLFTLHVIPLLYLHIKSMLLMH